MSHGRVIIISSEQEFRQHLTSSGLVVIDWSAKWYVN